MSEIDRVAKVKKMRETGAKKNFAMVFMSGLFVAILSGREMLELINENNFIWEFPGDWNLIIFTGVGVFFMLRSFKFLKS
ncbi:hypothetical protein A9Q91_04175 [Candidatus Gracilibacteria bacterium 28_42_T64]|nr:hypothetical protein A9Q91_04175 [Candidatus Gracilibacteria bacterium 28_42_T64]